MNQRRLRHECLAELVGTYILVFFGVGAVHAAVLSGAQSGLWQVAVVWGVAIALAIYATSAISGTHINPSITVAMTVFRDFPRRKVPWYVASQLLGALLAAATLYGLYGGVLASYEAAHGIVRGQPGSELSAMVYANYFPHPGLAAALHWAPEVVNWPAALVAEGLGTALLALFVFALTDARNAAAPGGRVAPAFIGLTVSALISVLAPLSQASFNPARDLGPRLVAYFAGWGAVAIPGPRGWFLTVYTLAPLVGALGGAAVYHYLLRPGLAATDDVAAPAVVETLMPQVKLILVGGFLGAGKTTLLWQVAERLAAHGRRVGLITNDQAPDLVDTGLLAQRGLAVREVAGSCFCCNFPGLLAAAEGLRHDLDADVLLAEPVGSCTDLSATILQPLKDRYHQTFSLAPLSVLVDPDRLRELLAKRPGRLHDSAAYIVRKQLEEADLIVLNKIDRLAADERAHLEALLAHHFPGATIIGLSALTGEGLDAWLEAVLTLPAGGHKVVEVDYDRYAEGEAVLGWLNATIGLTARGQADWAAFAAELMDQMQSACRELGAEIGHVKLLLSSAGGRLVANLTQTDGAVSVLADGMPAGPTAELVLNARVETSPARLEAMVRERLAAVAASAGLAAEVRQLRCLSPGRPQPTFRYDHVIPVIG